MSIRFKITLGLIIIILASYLILFFFTSGYVNKIFVREAQSRVQSDLNSADDLYDGNIDQIYKILKKIAEIPPASNNQLSASCSFEEQIKSDMENVFKDNTFKPHLDILTLIDTKGNVLYRAHNPSQKGDNVSEISIIKKAMHEWVPVKGAFILNDTFLRNEGEDLLKRSLIKIYKTPKSRDTLRMQENSEMFIAAAIPLTSRNSNKKSGILLGGILINNNNELVDQIKTIVFQNQKFEGKDMGAASITFDDIRISTNVKNNINNKRSIGSQLSKEVWERVIKEGKHWSDRTFVVNDWYITAYEPIKDPEDKIIGSLGIGLLEEPFRHPQRIIIIYFALALSITAAASLILLFFITKMIMRPIEHVVNTSKKIMNGDLSARCNIIPTGEIGILCEAIDQMAESIQQHENKLQEQTRMQMLQSEKLASVGRLAAGVAHEINNPLTGVLTFAHFLKDKREKLLENSQSEQSADAQADLQDINVIIHETTRVRDIIRGLLDFARQSPPNKEMLNVNETIQQLLILIKGQKEFRNIKINEEYAKDLPELFADKNQLQQVFLNLLLNSGEAISGPGSITISTKLSTKSEQLIITFSDTGSGISEEDMSKIFDPFFTTKPVGKGTGLGLSVSYGIIQQHGGTIKCESKQGEGTTFTINLPLKN